MRESGDMRRRVISGGRLIAFVCSAALFAGCGANAYLVKPVSVPTSVEMVGVAWPDGWTFNKIAVIDIEGILREGPESHQENPVTILRRQLELAEGDGRVKGVILRINSPGGTAAAADLAYAEVMRFKRRSGKPVVAFIPSLGTSGGYYVALAADEIYVAPAAITGSIGVIMQLYNVEGLLTKIGVETETLKTGEEKDMGSPFRKLTEEDRAIFEGLLHSFHARFVSLIAERRKLSAEEVAAIADGRVFTAKQAASHRLVDGEAYADAVFDRTKQLSKIGRARLVGFSKPFPSGGFSLTGIKLDPLKISLPGTDLAPGFYYLWLPGKQ